MFHTPTLYNYINGKSWLLFGFWFFFCFTSLLRLKFNHFIMILVFTETIYRLRNVRLSSSRVCVCTHISRKRNKLIKIYNIAHCCGVWNSETREKSKQTKPQSRIIFYELESTNLRFQTRKCVADITQFLRIRIWEKKRMSKPTKL